MNELHYFKKYLEEEMDIAFNRKNLQDTSVKLDVARIDNLQTVMRIIGEYEHYLVNCDRNRMR